MDANAPLYRATYFREIPDQGKYKEVEIELKNLFTFPEGVCLQLVTRCFLEALCKGRRFVVLTVNESQQRQFTKIMMDRYRGDLYSPSELDLNSIMISIWKKSREQVDYELDLFYGSESIEDEMRWRDLAESKCNQQFESGCSQEILTRRQIQHLVAVMMSFGRRRGSLTL